MTCLKQGGKGSAVVATTRDVELAWIMTMCASKWYNIKKLSDKHLKEMIQS